MGKPRKIEVPFKSRRIATKLLVWFLAVALLPLIFFSVVTYTDSVKLIESEMSENLVTIANNRVFDIDMYLLRREKNVIMLAKSPVVVDTIERFNRAFERGGTTLPELLKTAGDEFGRYLSLLYGVIEFYDILLVSRHGDVFFSTKEEADLGSNLKTGPLRDTELAGTYEAAKTLMQPSVSDFKYYPPSDGPAVFIAVPVFRGKNIIGAVVGQLDSKRFYEISGRFMGLGKTGETMLVLKDADRALFVSPLRHDPDAAFNRSVEIGYSEFLPVQEVVKGKYGTGVYTDYRGKRVMAVWRYIPAIRCGVVIKIDLQEMFAPVYHLRNWFLIVGFVVVVIVVLLAMFVSRSISSPIIALTRTTKELATGDLTVRTGVKSNDEMGMLAASFNEMAENLQKGQAQLIQAEKLSGVGQLASGVAHELNSPLDGLLTFMRLRKKESGDDTDKEELSLMLRAGEHMATIIKDLVAFSRESKGEYSELDLNEMIESTLSFSAGQLSNSDVQIEKDYSKDLMGIWGEKSRLQQVVINMITNSRDAMPDGGRFVVKTYNSEDGNRVVMEFVDTGIGIKEEDLPRIFDPFFTTKGPGKGVGLGLSISYEIVKNHKGEMLVESQPGEGARFIISLPRLKAKEESEA